MSNHRPVVIVEGLDDPSTFPSASSTLHNLVIDSAVFLDLTSRLL